MNQANKIAAIDLLERIWRFLALALAIGGMVVSALWLSKPYSYWCDELFSVTASHGSFRYLHELLIHDVHPPLYQLVLKLWMWLWGDSEPATRALSWLFATSAACYLYLKTLKFGKLFSTTALLLFTTNWLYAFYANETRSYAMALFLATVFVVNLPTGKKGASFAFLASGVLLSLTHYFGLIVTGVTFAAYLIQNFKYPRSTLPVLFSGILCLVWPVHHLMAGELLGKTGGNFWIEVNGVLESLGMAASGFIPGKMKVTGFVLVIVLVFSLAAARTHLRKKGGSNHSPLPLVQALAAIALAFLGLIAAIDLWSPISTPKNYIVLLPYLSISVAGAFAVVVEWHRRMAIVLFGFLIVFCSTTLFGSFERTRGKSMAFQDWRGASEYIIENHQGRDIVYLIDQRQNGWRHLLANYYLKKFSNGTLEARPHSVGEGEIRRPAIVLVSIVPMVVFLSGDPNLVIDAVESELARIDGAERFGPDIPLGKRPRDVRVYVSDSLGRWNPGM